MSAPGGFTAPAPHGLVVASGTDTWRFLQDLVSQDLDPLVDGGGVHSLLLDPRGRITAEFRVSRVGDAAWLDTADGPGLAEALGRYRIRVEVDLDDRSSSTQRLSVRGSDATSTAADTIGIDIPADVHDHVEVPGSDGVRAIRVTWNGAPGLDLVGPADAIADIETGLAQRGVDHLDEEAFERLRIEAGVARSGVDYDETTLPHEVLLDRRAVSFSKGCFLGQEIVGRIDARGRAPKLLRHVETHDTVPDVGAELFDAAGNVVGTLTSVATRPDGGAVGLAVLPVAIDPPAELRVGAASATVTAID